MRIVLDTGGTQRELAVAVEDDSATVADLLAAVGRDPTTTVRVDGRRVPSRCTLVEAAVPDGTVVRLGDATPPPAAGAGGDHPRLSVVAGPGAGTTVVLDRTVLVGRDPACDLVVPSAAAAPRHCRVVGDHHGRAVVTDLATTRGTWVGGRLAAAPATPLAVGEVLRVGGAVLRLEPPAGADRPSPRHAAVPDPADRGVPFNRPPRSGAPPPVPPVGVPPAPAGAEDAPPVHLVALLLPLVLGGALVLVLGSWRYAAFLAYGSLLLLGTTVAARHRHRRGRGATSRARRAALTTFAAELAHAAAADRARRWELLPSVTEVVRRATQPATRLWERRPDHDDALALLVGVGAVPWAPPVRTDGPGAQPPADALAVLEQWAHLPRSPVGVELADGGVVGLAGDRRGAVAVARALLLQACVHHGPADVQVAVATAAAHREDWHWATWLPHTVDRWGRRRLAAGTAPGRTLLRSLEPGATPDATLLLVVDDPGLLHGRGAAAAPLLRGDAGPVAGIVLADAVDQLPATCSAVVEVLDAEGRGRLTRPARREVIEDVVLTGLPVTTCRDAARRLAGLDDPELPHRVADLPVRVDLLELLPDGLDVGAAWDRTRDAPHLRVPVGRGPEGTVVVDLLRDGPHGLLGGTTGAGKSELLRTVVAGLAAEHDPERCTFVLVDYKGGAAFDACADLPHVVGVVTDLDEHLGARALRCLEAELTHRERRLRDAGVSDLTAWQRLPRATRGEPLPRLVVVVDEFATLRAELPDFVSALVGIAQRGRSLGVHLLLGTQRPSGAVDEDVRANTNLRLALRMTDRQDSLEVVGVGDAAAIPPATPGRGVLRSGPGAPVRIQAALVTGCSRAVDRPVRVGPLRFGPEDLPPVPPTDRDGPTDLDRLVDACRAAWSARGLPPPRTPWPPPLPASLDPATLPPAPDVPVPLGLLDDPARQRQVTVGWDPARGNLLVLGMVGSGTTTTLATLALAAARRHTPDELHLHVLDLGRGELAPLAGLPHCGAVVTAGEVERRARLVTWLLAEAQRRRCLGRAALDALPLQVLLVDGLAAWFDELDDPATHATLAAVQRLVTDAPQLRMAVVGTAPRHGAVRTAVATATEQRLVHRLADPNDHALLGLRPGSVPDLPAGRALRPDGGVLQVARVAPLDGAVAAIAAASPPATDPPAPVGSLPVVLRPRRLRGEVALGDGPWRLPVGRDALDLRPVSWTLHRGDHALVLGPPGSGRSALLRGLAELAAAHVRVVALAADGATWPDAVEVHRPADLAAVLQEVAGRSAPTLVLVDDADRIDDPGTDLDGFEGAPAPAHLVAAARGDVVRSDYGHWLRRVARHRTGLLLRPGADVPGDLFGAHLPRRPPVPVRPSRGWLVAAGEPRFVQAVAVDG